MKKCNLSDFIEAMEPWFSRDYIRKVYMYNHRVIKLFFVDGVVSSYYIDDCNDTQFQDIVDKFQQKGIPVTE